MPAPFLRALSLDEQWHVSARDWHRLNVEPQQLYSNDQVVVLKTSRGEETVRRDQIKE
jgi:hypothetical protein